MQYEIKENKIFIHATKSVESSPDDVINESIIDMERKTLSPDVFTEGDILLPKIRDFIVNSFKSIFESCGVDNIKTVYIIGSILGKYYNDYTDIDCQAVIDTDSETMSKVWDEIEKRFQVGYVYIDDNTHPINFFVRQYTNDEELYPKSIDGIYDVWKNEWIQKFQPKITIDPSIYQVSMNWCRKIEMDIGEIRRDIIEFLFYSNGEKNKDKLSIDVSQIESYRSMKFKEIVYDLSNIRSTMIAMKEWRTVCQKSMTDEYIDKTATPGEITVTYSNAQIFDGIIVWKLLDRFGYITLMGNLRYILNKYDKQELSQEQLITECSKVLHLENLFKH